MRPLQIFCMGFVLTTYGLPAQELRYEVESQENRPLALSVTPHIDDREPYLTIQLTNVSKKEVVAYGLLVSSRKATGGTRPVQYIQRRKLAAASTAKQPFSSGKTFKPHTVTPITDRAGKPLPLVITLDYVLFADGSKWGPDQEIRGAEMAAYLWGSEEILRTLKGIRNQEGLTEVTVPDQVEAPANCDSCSRKK